MSSKIYDYIKKYAEPEMTALRHVKRSIQSKYPIELQLPITYKCNFNCVMCGMHELIKNSHFSVEEISHILSNPLFKEIRNVGINGGEPFLRNDLPECIRTVIEVLPKVKGIYIITNGYFTDKILASLREIKRECTKQGVRLSVSVSLDGIEDMQDFMRGKVGAYSHALETVRRINVDKNSYCDQLGMICTITKFNIARIVEVEKWQEQMGIPVSFNLATINRRINNEDRVKDFSVFSDEEARLLAQEFFYKQYNKTHDEKYFGLYLFVKTGKRMAYCAYRGNDGVTITPDGQLGYCATHSKNLGDTREKSAEKLFRASQKYHKKMCRECCETCSHYLYQLDYAGKSMLRKEQQAHQQLYVLKKFRNKKRL